MQPHSASLKRSLERAARTYHEQLDQSAWAYLDSRGLGEATSPGIATQHLLGVVRSPIPGHERYEGRLAIPYIGPKGNIYDVRYRCLEQHDHSDPENHCPKYLGADGVSTRMFNTRALTAPTDYIILCEGELDAVTITACGWPAVAVAGANAWKAHHARMLAGFSRVLVLADGDDAGRGLAAKVTRSLPSTAVTIMLREGHDINSLYVQGGKEALVELLREKSEDE